MINGLNIYVAASRLFKVLLFYINTTTFIQHFLSSFHIFLFC